MPPGGQEDPKGAVARATTQVGPTRSPAPDRESPPIGERIGRFTVLEELGRGGMSVVLSAYDPKLDRRVALKLMRPGGGGSDETGEVRARLLREAQAMAGLRHRNILTVHDAGEHEGQVYVAMEHVEGGNLRDELGRLRSRGSAPDWRRVVRLFVEAGRGLMAAHQAGLIHRDFKPDNVLVDRTPSDTPRVVVADFGLVGVERGAAGAARGSGRAAPADGRLTADDVVIGTPLYMPPEQHRGLPLDARADQFAFCVSLYEALYRELPFAGQTREDYAGSVERGEVRPAPAESGVPTWVREVLLRGLRPAREERYGSMEELLAEFADEGTAEARRWRVSAGVTIGLGFVAIGAVSLGADITYPGLQLANGIALGIVILIYLVARHRLLRSRFNRQLYSVLLAGVVIVSLTHAGAQLAGFHPEESLLLIPLVSGAAASALAVLVGRLLAPMALGYLAAFLGAAAWPQGALLAIMLGHAIAFANAVLVMHGGGARSRRER